MKNKIVSWLILIIGFFIIVNLSRSIISLLKKGEIITRTEEKLADVREENEKLKKELEKVQSKEFIEKQAREKLNLGREGELVIILPSISPLPKEEKTEREANWQKWLAIFK